MAQVSLTPASRGMAARDFALLAAVLVCAILALFYHSLDPNLAIASNDAPLGLINAESGRDASTISGLFTGYWQDLNWLGIEQPSVLPSPSFILYAVFFGGNAITNAKFYAPVSLIFVGFCAWLFFRQLGFRNSVCVLCGLAASLNMNSFSNACWGLPTRALTQGSIFLALAALQSATLGRFWLKAVLAGLAVGFAVMEGFDVGAIYSLFIAAFAFFLVLVSGGKSLQQSAPRGIAFVAVIAICAGWLSAHALNTLIGTQITGVSGMQQDVASKQRRWEEATQWSLPKIETSRLLVPGLFGYRMEPNPSRYWGDVGQSSGMARHSGSGEYAGVLVVLLAVWGVASAFRKSGGSLTVLEKKWVKFWSVAALIALVLAWGHHAPFYQIVYALPYFSTIRNPIKFMHIFHLCLLVLFGFGLEELFRGYIARANAKKLGLTEQLKSWWKTAAGFERKWVYGAVGFGLASLLGTFIFISSNRELTNHLQTGGFSPQEIPQIIAFSTHELWLYILFYALSLAVVLIAFSGWFSAGRWKVAVGLMGLIIFVDLARANMPWIIYYNYKERYSSNPVIDLLKEKTHDQRASFRLAPFAGVMFVNPRQVQWWDQLVFIWHQQLFQYYNIPSLEPTQMPRIPELDNAFFTNFLPKSTNQQYLISRMWELAGTRYFLGQTGFAEGLNSEYDPGKNRVRNYATFNIVPKANSSKTGGMGIDDITAEISTNGAFSVMEFTGALPRVKLFNTWQTPPNDETTLQILRAPDFDPSEKVLVASSGEPLPAPAPLGTNVTATASFTNYKPKVFEVQTSSTAPGVLLVNDKFSPHWKATVDGKEATLLRCNFIMRGVYVAAGNHKVEFQYRPPVNSLYVTLTAMGAGILLLGILVIAPGRKSKPVTP